MAHIAHVHAKVTLPKDDDEKQLVLEYVELVFTETFGFAFPPSDSFSPPGASNPANLHVSEKEATLHSARPGDIDEFLKSAFADLHLPSWIQGDSQKDVLKLSSTILEAVTDQWQFVSLAKVYNPQDLATDNPIKADVIVVFYTGTQVFPGGPVQTTELGVAAVYYDLLPSADWAKFQLRLSAYSTAGMGLADGKKVVRNDKSLAEVATEFSTLEFSRDFPYQWGQTPPDFINKEEYALSKNTALGYFDNGIVEKAESFVVDKVLKGAPVPSWAQGTVVAALADAISTALTLEPNARSWSPRKFDQSYDDPKGRDGSFRVNGVLMYFAASQKLNNNHTVQIAYVFWLGETYTISALKTTVYNDMIAELYSRLHAVMSNVSTSGIQPDKAGLLELLNRCSSFKFQSYHGYDFKGDKTKPTSSNGDEVYAVAAFAEFGTVTEAVISDWTIANILRPDTFSFFSTVPQIQSDLNDRIKYWLTQNSSTTRNNSWGITKFPQSYDHPNSDSKVLRGDSVVFYANGGKTERGLAVNSNMLCFVGVYYVADIVGDESDDAEI